MDSPSDQPARPSLDYSHTYFTSFIQTPPVRTHSALLHVRADTVGICRCSAPHLGHRHSFSLEGIGCHLQEQDEVHPPHGHVTLGR